MELIKELPALGHNFSPGLLLIGLLSLLATGVGCIYQEWEAIVPMLTAAIALCGLGLALRALPKTERKPRISTSIAATALVWGIVGFCGALPFICYDISFIDAIFESMSAWTGTGFSVISNLEEWPHALLFWRSLMQWIGGLGIIAFTMTVMSRVGFNRGLAGSENKAESFLPSVTATALQMWKIYAVLTLISFIIILCTGVGIWDALNLSLCTISTGGLTMYSNGLAHYDSFPLEMALIPVMFMGAIPFRLYYLTYKQRSVKEILHDRILWIMLIIFAALAVIFIAGLMITGPANGTDIGFSQALRDGLFMAASFASSAGFQNVEPTLIWAKIPVTLMIVFMLIGGPQGSTAGGIKLERIVVAFEAVVWWIRKSVGSSKSVVSFRHEKKAVPDEMALKLLSGSLVTILLSLVLLLITIMLLLLDPYFIANIPGTIFDVFSCIGNNGISCGMFGSAMPDFAKVLLFFVMWIARLEIIPVLVLIRGIFRGFEWK